MLTQAIEAESKEDREIICAEVFADITGELDALAKGSALDQLERAGQASQLAPEQCRLQRSLAWRATSASMRSLRPSTAR